ncbi:MAG: hypothetical protein VKL39_03895 [Leptolyngbyaceae bacterium]|nr:hypothetical protein [Leptolyngbyaceae bacterium]
MDITQLIIQVIVAIVCAGIANIFIPRRIPGKLTGLVLVGLAGVWVGEWGFAQLRDTYSLNFPFLQWDIQGVEIVPAIIGCAIVLYVITAIVKWWRRGQ